MTHATIRARSTRGSSCDRGGAQTLTTCSLCGATFARDGAACSGCPLHARCGIANCPNCGFSAPVRSRWAEWLRGLLGIPGEESA